MILVDTSVWIDHLRAGDATLATLLEAERVLIHPFVVGELALGSLRDREMVLDALRDLPAAAPATDDEVQRMIDIVPLHGLGIGYVDAHLLASVRLTSGSKLWTRDRRLLAAAERLQLAAHPAH
ncbi:ribonuclease [Burkholderia stabilis]|uniref:type II toxin-antitoxin system VapC family toxin n=1 Tax=Burkholderia stabilis TaxID=95485 RepID=UPI0008521620|nr:type II toxin-antitoxin system VapC family toxin [Burkholderia stabilis]AOR71060.1 ribonuclease [Burkholderia stabilis]HDR9493815.1 type II toxin-antitoxin system VapC family toxin [Burkholderia stabilis]HDR9523770.1 type II toxin-antitoxin system VapC family toxin [Burkholderia stabilis]HDR9528187.1 type II toxin-antitoxin system VapC family toxin [Burkholderia stabilis]HDR9531506.1 type II toxin-antitoxin system VapC family toxin [Burkholderia stabilis]